MKTTLNSLQGNESKLTTYSFNNKQFIMCHMCDRIKYRLWQCALLYATMSDNLPRGDQ